MTAVFSSVYRAIVNPHLYFERLPGETEHHHEARAVMAVLRDQLAQRGPVGFLAAIADEVEGDDDEPDALPAAARQELIAKAWGHALPDTDPGGCTCGGHVDHAGVFHAAVMA